MKKWKKALAVLLVCLLLTSLLPTTALAAGMEGYYLLCEGSETPGGNPYGEFALSFPVTLNSDGQYITFTTSSGKTYYLSKCRYAYYKNGLISDCYTNNLTTDGLNGFSSNGSNLYFTPTLTPGTLRIPFTYPRGELCYVYFNRTDAVPTSLHISPGLSVVPIPFDGYGSNTYWLSDFFNLEVLDQFGNSMENIPVENLQWSLGENTPRGVSINHNRGTFSVSNEAKYDVPSTEPVLFTVTVSCTIAGVTKTASTTLGVQRVKTVSPSNKYAFFRSDKEGNLLKDEDGNTINQPPLTSDVQEIPQSGSRFVYYTIKALDKYGSLYLSGANPGVELTPSHNDSYGANVTVMRIDRQSVAVQIMANSPNNSSTTIVLAGGDYRFELPIRLVKDINFQFTGEAKVREDKAIYGYSFNEILDLSDLKVLNASGAEIPGRFFVKNGDSYPNPVEAYSHPYEILFTSDDGTYQDCSVLNGTLRVSHRPVTIQGIVASDKEYDGTTEVAVDISKAYVDQPVLGDSLNINSVNSASFDDPNVGEDKNVSVRVNVSGDNYSAYSIQQPTTVTASITPRTLTGLDFSQLIVKKAYDGTAHWGSSDITGTISAKNIVGNDDVQIVVDSINGGTATGVGTHSVTLHLKLIGTSAGNYRLEQDTYEVPASILASEDYTVTAQSGQTITAQSSEFLAPTATGIDGEAVDGTFTYQIGEMSNLTYRAAVEVLKEQQPGTISIAYSFTPADGSNYTSVKTGSFSVELADIHFTVNGMPATSENVFTVKEGPTYGDSWTDIVTIAQNIQAQSGDNNVDGTYSLDVSGTPDAGTQNFTLQFTTADGEKVYPVCSGSVNIAKQPLTVTGLTATDKVYDGTANATLAGTAQLSGVLEKDAISIESITARFENKNVGTGKPVTVEVSIAGANTDNYTLTQPAGLTANIAPLKLDASEIDLSGINVTRAYDGTAHWDSGDVIGMIPTPAFIVSGDDVQIVFTAISDSTSSQVGADYTVTLTLGLEGKDADNYQLDSNTYQFTGASITPSGDYTITAPAGQTVFQQDGAFTTPTATGFNSETVDGTFTYTVGTQSGLTYDQAKAALLGHDVGEVSIGYSFAPTDDNYTGTKSGSFTVNVVDIVFTADDNPATSENAFTLKTSPTYGDSWSEIVTISDKIEAKIGESAVEGTYSLDVSGTPEAGKQDFTVQFTTAEGSKVYTVCSGSVDIAQKALTVTGLTAENKTYDGTATATLTGTAALSGVVGTDGVTLAGTPTAVFADENAAKDKAVTVSGYSLTGTDAANYTLTQPTGLTADIDPLGVTITGVTAQDKTYDGTTQAALANNGTVSGALASDSVSVLPGTLAFTDPNAADSVPVTAEGFGLQGDDAANYQLTAQPAVPNAKIAQAKYDGDVEDVTVDFLPGQATAYTGSLTAEDFHFTAEGARVSAISHGDASNLLTSAQAEDGAFTYESALRLTPEAETAYTVTLSSRNYQDVEAQVFFVTAAQQPVEITGVTVADKTYDGQPVSYAGTPTATGSGETIAMDFTFTWQTADGTALSGAPKDAGDYQLVVTPDDPLYAGSLAVSFTIEKAQVTIQVHDARAYIRDELPRFTYTVRGLAQGEQLTREPSLTCDTDMRFTGEYPIVASGAQVPAGGNYRDEIVYIDGTLTVFSRPIVPTEAHDIRLRPTTHGQITANVDEAPSGRVITLRVYPDADYSLDTLTVVDADGNQLRLTREDGAYQFVMPDCAVTVTATFVPNEGTLPFTDVAVGAWYYSAVEYVYSHGVMDGVGGGRFDPNGTTTRAMLVTMLHRMAGTPSVRGGRDFLDVPSGAWYADAVAWASETGVVNGVGGGSFAPNAPITREQLAAVLYRYAGAQPGDTAVLDSYRDKADISAYARDAMAWAVEKGLLEGRAQSKLEPQGSATRAEIATVFMRFFG